MGATNKEKADKLIKKGDTLLAKGKHKRALKKFKKAKELDPERSDIYDRLVNAHEKATTEWSEEDVALSVSWTMEKQEAVNPSMKLIHERLTPEWSEIMTKIGELIVTDQEDDEDRIIQEIQGYGEQAIHPLIHTILQIKKGAGDSEKDDSSCIPENTEPSSD